MQGGWAVGDELERLHTDQFATLARLAAALTGDRDGAEDVVQDAFAKVYVRRHRIRDPLALERYVRSAVMNTARHRRSRRDPVARLSREPRRSAASAEEGAVASDTRRAILERVWSLPRRQRECVALRYFADLPEAEIAATLGVSAGSVKTHLHRALRALEQPLKELR